MKPWPRQRNWMKKEKQVNAIGKLHGVVIGIKDVIAYKDHPLSASSKILKGFSSIYSATADRKITRGRSDHYRPFKL